MEDVVRHIGSEFSDFMSHGSDLIQGAFEKPARLMMSERSQTGNATKFKYMNKKSTLQSRCYFIIRVRTNVSSFGRIHHGQLVGILPNGNQLRSSVLINVENLYAFNRDAIVFYVSSDEFVLTTGR